MEMAESSGIPPRRHAVAFYSGDGRERERERETEGWRDGGENAISMNIHRAWATRALHIN